MLIEGHVYCKEYLNCRYIRDGSLICTCSLDSEDCILDRVGLYLPHAICDLYEEKTLDKLSSL